MQRATQIVVELLAKGSDPAEVAELTGNTVSAICQVRAKYIEQITAKQADAQLAGASHSSKLDKIEGLLADKMIGMIALETDIMKVGNMMKSVNSMTRRDAGERGGASGGTVVQNIVQLNLPQHLSNQIKVVTNTNNDVVAVDGRDLTPAAINQVNSMAGILTGDTHEQVERTTAFDDILQAEIPVSARFQALDSKPC